MGQSSTSIVNPSQPVEPPTIPPASPRGHTAAQPINHVAQPFMDGAAAESIAGLSLSNANYEEAIVILKASNLATIHTLKCASEEVECKNDVLAQELKRFWDLETVGIQSQCVYEEFLESILYVENHYEVKLPWKHDHAELPDNYDLSKKRLLGLLKRLRNEPEVLKEYYNVIRDQLNKEIVESAPKPNEEIKSMHYLPHHAVIRQDKTTTKLRVVYDALAKSRGPSLNDCLYSGPSLTQNIVDIMMRFRAYKVALTGDIEKAFLMIHVAESDRDALRFLWVDDVHSPNPKIILFRFTRVVFGVSSSPFLLNATVKHHIEQYREDDPSFVETFLNSIYVDDLISGGESVDSTFKLYEDSRNPLAKANFNLRKITTNSKELQERICQANQLLTKNDASSESIMTRAEPKHLVQEEQSSYAGRTLWDSYEDNFIIDLKDVAELANDVQPTKRNVISVSSKIYDPIGFISPLAINFKLLFQELCMAKGDWDHPLQGTLKCNWQKLVENLREVQPVVIPRYYVSDVQGQVVSYELHGFCDASIKALELLSALVLARLTNVTQRALEFVIEISKVQCWTDSKVELYWITQQEEEWTQYVQSRVEDIRGLFPAKHWSHCPGVENPADIPSRGILPTQLASSTLWWSGPKWLSTIDNPGKENCDSDVVPEECRAEMKVKDQRALSRRQKDLSTNSEVTRVDIELAQVLWIKELQVKLKMNEKFKEWNRDLGLFTDESGVVRCKGILSNYNLPYSAKYQIPVDTAHYLTTLIIRDCHARVMHRGVKATLTELRSKFWLVRGRSFVRKLLFNCVTCNKQDGKAYLTLNPPPLPEFRVKEAPPFTYVGLDYVGPLYVKSMNHLDEKAWICLITCCVSRAVHLEVVPNMTSQDFLKSFRRFTSRRSTLLLVISDNAKTFKAASKELMSLMRDPQVKKYFLQQRMHWLFNLEKALWWGGFFERLVWSLKQCLKRTIGRARLSLKRISYGCHGGRIDPEQSTVIICILGRC
ncbi:uncharacterized protein LOC114533731 [Dendronephthya gigantea]|uniref:uncharacterized protein LOC114533731 n=1 Tax=Dendronephthya gigantea TaxID=151771 RepID=UPI00106DD2D3|nr:uncharacterized protein LOC114533731 [Dendronephthya gigantea]